MMCSFSSLHSCGTTIRAIQVSSFSRWLTYGRTGGHVPPWPLSVLYRRHTADTTHTPRCFVMLVLLHDPSLEFLPPFFSIFYLSLDQAYSNFVRAAAPGRQSSRGKKFVLGRKGPYIAICRAANESARSPNGAGTRRARHPPRGTRALLFTCRFPKSPVPCHLWELIFDSLVIYGFHWNLELHR